MKKFSVPEAAEELGYTEQYVRVLIQRGYIESNPEPREPDSLVMRHMVSEDELERFKIQHPTRNRRRDGRNKFVAYMTPAEYDEAIRILKAAGPHMRKVAELIQPANPIKGFRRER